jgi:hypothetical protein
MGKDGGWERACGWVVSVYGCVSCIGGRFARRAKAVMNIVSVYFQALVLIS